MATAPHQRVIQQCTVRSFLYHCETVWNCEREITIFAGALHIVIYIELFEFPFPFWHDVAARATRHAIRYKQHRRRMGCLCVWWAPIKLYYMHKLNSDNLPLLSMKLKTRALDTRCIVQSLLRVCSCFHFLFLNPTYIPRHITSACSVDIHGSTPAVYSKILMISLWNCIPTYALCACRTHGFKPFYECRLFLLHF